MRVAGHFFQADSQKRCSAWRPLIAHDEDVVEHGVHVKFVTGAADATREPRLTSRVAFASSNQVSIWPGQLAGLRSPA
jgi:hypothetical protein